MRDYCMILDIRHFPIRGNIVSSPMADSMRAPVRRSYDPTASGGIIDDRLSDYCVDRDRIASIIGDTGIYEVEVVRDLIDSVWDVDKMDYLLRDSQLLTGCSMAGSILPAFWTRLLYTMKIPLAR